MWVKNIANSLKNKNTNQNKNPPHNSKFSQNDQMYRNYDKPGYHAQNQSNFSNPSHNTHFRGGYNLRGRGGPNPHYGGRGGYQGNSRFERNENNFTPNFFNNQRK